MSLQLKERFALNSIRSKVIFGFALVCIVITCSWITMRVTFSHTLQEVEKMSAPSKKLKLAQQVSKGLYQLGRGPQYIQQDTVPLRSLLDTLRTVCMKDEDSTQVHRIDYMLTLLDKHEQLFPGYHRLRKDVMGNKWEHELKQITSSMDLQHSRPDSSLVTSEKITTTTTTVTREPLHEEKPSLFKRIFKKKTETDAIVTDQQIREERRVHVDTLTSGISDSLLRSIENTISSIEQDKSNKSQKLMQKEMQLVIAGNTLVNEMVQMLQEIEHKEILSIRASQEEIAGKYGQNLNTFAYVMVGCILLFAFIVFFIFSDISRSNQYRAQLVAAREEAERQAQAKHHFLASMSHELRTPLQSIIGFSEQAIQNNPQADENTRIIHQSSKHLLQIVNEVLDYSQLGSGKFSFDAKAFDMNELLQEVINTMRQQAEKKNIGFKFESNEKVQRLCNGDAFRLKQILYNIIGNAIKFTQTGSVTLRMHFTEHKKRTSFVFEIIDTGPGIPPADLQRIFSAYEQVGSSGHIQSGTGLGLNIARRLAELQGGSVHASSEVGKGSVFTVSMHYTVAGIQAVTATDSIPTLPDTQHMQVLAVDDDQLILKLYQTILDKHKIGYRCFAGAEALLNADIDTSKFYIVLADINMPGMDGVSLLKKIRQRFETRPVVFASTALLFPEELENLRKEGFDGILVKPFMEKDLVDLLKGCYDKGQNTVKAKDVLPEEEPDLKSLVQISMNDPVLLQENLLFMAEDTAKDLEELENACRKKNTGKIIDNLHKLAGKTGQAGAHQLYIDLKKMELRLRKGQEPLEAMEEVAKLCRRVAAFKQMLEKKANQIVLA